MCCPASRVTDLQLGNVDIFRHLLAAQRVRALCNVEILYECIQNGQFLLHRCSLRSLKRACSSSSPPNEHRQLLLLHKGRSNKFEYLREGLDVRHVAAGVGG